MIAETQGENTKGFEVLGMSGTAIFIGHVIGFAVQAAIFYKMRKNKKSGVEVELLNEGQGDLCPVSATIVARCTTTLDDGSVLDWSPKPGKPFSAQLSVGQTIKGWDEAFTQMRKG